MTYPSTTDLNSMDDIVRPAITLLRNERWRIRESIYCNRTARSKNEIARSSQILSDESLREHYSELLVAVRNQMNSLHNNEENSNDTHETDEETIFETLRQRPEIMMRIYSYLPLGDRICRLSLVDKAFSRDTIRGGIVSATYGAGFNLKQALLELQRWAMDALQRIRDFTRDMDRWTLNEMAHLRDDEDFLRFQRQVERMQSKDMEIFERRLEKISLMLEIGNLSNGEPLLFSGSNLRNTIVTPKQRKRWITSYAHDFIAREKQEWKRQYSYSWLEETLLIQNFLKRYFFDGTVGRLEQLMEEVDFLEDYKDYKRCQEGSLINVNENEGVLKWPLPDLSPSCNLMFLDGNEGWKEHRLVTCFCCKKLVSTFPDSYVGCQHGHHVHICVDCKKTNKTKVNEAFCAHCRSQHLFDSLRADFDRLSAGFFRQFPDARML